MQCHFIFKKRKWMNLTWKYYQMVIDIYIYIYIYICVSLNAIPIFKSFQYNLGGDLDNLRCRPNP